MKNIGAALMSTASLLLVSTATFLLSCSPALKDYYVDQAETKREGYVAFKPGIDRYEPGAELEFRVQKEAEAVKVPLARIKEFRTGQDRYLVIPAGLVRSPVKTSANSVSWPAKVLLEGKVSLYSVELLVPRQGAGEIQKAEAVVHVVGLGEGSFLLVPQDTGNFLSWAALVRGDWKPPASFGGGGYASPEELRAFVRSWNEDLGKSRP